MSRVAGVQGQGLSRAASGGFFLSTPGCGLLAALLVGGRRLPWSVVLGPGGAIAILHGSLLRCGGLTAVLVGGQRNIHHAGGPHLVVLKTKNFFEDLVLPRDRMP